MLQQITIVTGILLAFASNWLIANTNIVQNTFSATSTENWRLMFEAQLVPALIFLVGLFFVPESPRWLLTKNKVLNSEKVFKQIYNKNDVRPLIDSVKESIINDSDKKVDWASVFSDKYRKRLLIGVTFAAIAQLTGINIIFYYAPKIFEQTHTDISILTQTVLTGIINLLFTLVALFFIDKLGRKRLMLFGSFSMGISMAILSFIFYLNQLNNYFVLILILLYIAFFAVSWGATIWVYISEIFPNNIRGTASSIATFANWTMNFFVSLTFPFLLSRLGGAATFGLYAIFNLLSFLFVYKFIFETKGETLEQIASRHI